MENLLFLGVPILKHIRVINVPVTKIAEVANSIDPDEAAHYEPPHLDLHCCSLILNS